MATLAALGLVHLAREWAPAQVDVELLSRLAFVPGRITFQFDPATVTDGLYRLASAGPSGLREAEVGRFFLGNGTSQPWTALTYALLHADWAHVGLNGLWLLAFGTPVARRLGAGRFLALLTVAALAGAIAHYATHISDLQPVIGASAAVSACMGAAVRFMFQPKSSLAALIASPVEQAPLFPPLRPLIDLFRDRRALGFVGAWFVTNLLFGLGSITLGVSEGAVAWQAHIGGFLTGLLFLPAFERGAPGASIPPGDAREGLP